jgi:hypothetical protein
VQPLILIEMARAGSPVRASELVTSIENGTARRNAATRIAEEWATHNPAAALKWSLKFDDEEHRPALVHGVFSRWGQRDPERALRGVETLDEPYLTAGAEGLLQIRNNQVLEALYAAVDSPGFRLKAAQRLAINLSRADRDRAAYYRAEADRLASRP